MFFFFFFQAEDGIRDYKVTGVQTCALPISPLSGGALRARSRGPPHHRPLRALRGRHGGAREGGDPAMGGGLSGGLDLNGRALEIADRMATNAEALRVSLRTLPGGARVIDAGI